MDQPELAAPLAMSDGQSEAHEPDTLLVFCEAFVLQQATIDLSQLPHAQCLIGPVLAL